MVNLFLKAHLLAHNLGHGLSHSRVLHKVTLHGRVFQVRVSHGLGHNHLFKVSMLHDLAHGRVTQLIISHGNGTTMFLSYKVWALSYGLDTRLCDLYLKNFQVFA